MTYPYLDDLLNNIDLGLTNERAETELEDALAAMKDEQTFWNTPERVAFSWLIYFAVTHLLKERGVGRVKRHLLAIVVNNTSLFALHPAEYKALTRTQLRASRALLAMAKENLR